jgi:hypothetical protein
LRRASTYFSSPVPPAWVRVALRALSGRNPAFRESGPPTFVSHSFFWIEACPLGKRGSIFQFRGNGNLNSIATRPMKLMEIEAIYPRAKTTIPSPGSQNYPYLLKDLEIIGPHQVWCTDIYYIPMARGFMYLVCLMDWYSSKIGPWELSNTLM